jgi:hypothetical protein
MLTTAGLACRTASTTGVSRSDEISRLQALSGGAATNMTDETNAASNATGAQRRRHWARSTWVIGG